VTPVSIPIPAVPGSSLTRRDWTIAFCVAVVSVIFPLILSHTRELWFDEFKTLATFKMTLPGMVSERIKAGHSPLYFFYARIGAWLGSATWQLRIPTVIMFPITILLLTGLAGELGLKRYLPGIWVLLLTQPYWIKTATLLRYMFPVLAVTSLTLWLLARFIRAPNAKTGAALAASGALLTWTSFSAAPILGAAAFFVVRESRVANERWNRRDIFRLLRPILLSILATLPLMILLRRHKPFSDEEFQLKGVWINLLDTIFTNFSLWPRLLNIPGELFIGAEIFVSLSAIVLARRELKRHEHFQTWRFLAALLIGIPGTFAWFCLFVRNFQGPSRYLICFSIPVLFCMALAWQAPANRYWKSAFRICLTALLLTQTGGLIFDRIERSREAFAWVGENQTTEPVFAASGPVARVALEYYGFTSARNEVVNIQLDVPDQLARQIKSTLKSHQGRAFFIYYHGHKPLVDTLDAMKNQGEIVDVRKWPTGDALTFGAIISDPSQKRWLADLPEPIEEWGSSLGPP
jgi:hypothetical protein